MRTRLRVMYVLGRPPRVGNSSRELRGPTDTQRLCQLKGGGWRREDAEEVRVRVWGELTVPGVHGEHRAAQAQLLLQIAFAQVQDPQPMVPRRVAAHRSRTGNGREQGAGSQQRGKRGRRRRVREGGGEAAHHFGFLLMPFSASRSSSAHSAALRSGLHMAAAHCR